MFCTYEKKVYFCTVLMTYQMAAVVQLVEQRIVVPCVVGSSPINRPSKQHLIGAVFLLSIGLKHRRRFIWDFQWSSYCWNYDLQ